LTPIPHESTLRELGIPPSLVACRGLQPHPEAHELELVEQGSDGREHWLLPAAARAWREMQAAAAGEGVGIFILSAYRSIERQIEIVRGKLRRGISIEEILRFSAPPGYSEHHTGRAVDVGTPGVADLERRFERTPAFSWLGRHADRFRFRLSYPVGNRDGYAYEPWHWCFVAEAEVVAAALRPDDRDEET
jgi:D-alanyl-D-alanine carboxypeptidase